MKTVPMVVSCLLYLACAAVAGDAEETVARSIRVMSSKAEPWANRCEAEDGLRAFPADLVLKALVPHVSKGMPSPMIWNSAGREHDKQAPVEWQVYYAVSRSWAHHLAGKPSKELGSVLLKLLPLATTPVGQQVILHDMARHWHPEAEAPLSQLMSSREADSAARRAAGLCLMLHKGKAYHEAFLAMAKSAPRKERKGWLDLLVDPRHKAETGVDPAIVRFGFELLAQERQANPNFVHGAYFIASDMGKYVGQTFTPDARLEEYRGEHGLRESFFADTVKNALAWWEKNRGRYE